MLATIKNIFTLPSTKRAIQAEKEYKQQLVHNILENEPEVDFVKGFCLVALRTQLDELENSLEDLESFKGVDLKALSLKELEEISSFQAVAIDAADSLRLE